jgi:hypothetical protein
MSIAGYLSSRKPEVRMPQKGSDELGIRFEGAVLTGEKSVEEGLRDSAAGAGTGVRVVLNFKQEWK